MRRAARLLAPAVAPALAVALALARPAPAPAQEATARFGAATGPTLTVLGTTDIGVFAPVLEAFAESRPGIAIAYEQWGSNALGAFAAAACAAGRPFADMVVSSAIDQQVRLVNEGCAQKHRSALTARLAPDLNWRDELFGVTREPAVMVYNRTLVAAAEAPRSRFDLIDLLRPADSRFIGRVATYDIEESGLGYLLAFADSQQATTFGSLLEAFARARVVATCCSAEIIEGVASGAYLVAYNVLGSYAIARAAEDPRLAIVVPEDYALVLSRAAMIPRSAREPGLAAALVDFLLSDEGRQVLGRARLVVSLGDTEDAELELPDGVASVLRPIALSPVLLAGLDTMKRALFLARWRAVMRPEP